MLHSGKELVYVFFNWYFETLCEPEVKDGGLIDLGEKTSRQSNYAQGVAWLLLTAFSQICSENKETKMRVECCKKLQLDQKGSACKVGAKESVVVEKISVKKEAKYSDTLVIPKCYYLQQFCTQTELFGKILLVFADCIG